MTKWSGVYLPDYPYNRVRVTVDNDGAVIMVTDNGERLLDENGERMTPTRPEPLVCDNRLFDTYQESKRPEKQVKVPNRADRRRSKRRSK